MTINVGGCSGDEAATMCGPGFDPRFYFFWPRATLHRQDKKSTREKESKSHSFTLRNNRSARTSNSTEEESCAEDFEFAEGSAQFWVSRNVGDGIVLPKDTRDTIDRDILCAILNVIQGGYLLAPLL